MDHVVGLKCLRCGREYGMEEVRYTCANCGGNLNVEYDYGRIAKRIDRKKLSRNPERSIWRYLPLYPVTEHSARRIPLEIGWTPLYRAKRLGNRLGLANLYLKDDGRMPSASFKDRASSVAIARALDTGADVICGASTGNAASSTACLTSAIPLRTIIFVPKTAPKAKIAQLLVFGAEVYAVEGSYDDAFDLCLEATAHYGWFNRNTGYNPYTREGKKNCSFEICEQLGWKVPAVVFVPVGDGNIISGIWKGFKDLHAVGLIDRLPRLVACQSALSSAVVNAVLGDGVIRKVEATTIADSISVDTPRDGEAAVKAVRESGGTGVAVTDEEILAAIPEIARGSGVFAEPAAAVTYACLKRACERGDVDASETVVILITGNGLKDVDAAIRVAGSPARVEPDIGSFRSVFEGRSRKA